MSEALMGFVLLILVASDLGLLFATFVRYVKSSRATRVDSSV